MSKNKIGRVGLVTKGEYDFTIEYKKLDLVSYEGSSYICKKDCVGIDVTNTEYWQLSAQAGADGAPGQNGRDGVDGAPGRDGVDGKDGDQGQKGDTGEQGPQGLPGEPGPKGDTGPQGEKGDKGDTGAQGIQGPKGDTGEKGDKGDKGDTGEKGDKGDPGEVTQAEFDALQNKVNDIEERTERLEVRTGHTYGIRRKINDNSSSEWERTQDAVGKTAAAKIATDTIPTNDFDKCYPWSQMKVCNINNEVYTFDEEPGFSRDGSNGNVFVHIPKFWFKRWISTDEDENTYDNIEIADYPRSGFIEMNITDPGAYNTSINNGKAESVSGKVPKYNYNKANFRNNAEAVGEKYCLLDAKTIFVIQMLFLVEYANSNSQVMLGQGIVNYSKATSIMAESNTNRIIVSSAGTGLYVGKTVCIGASGDWNNNVAADRQITAIEDYDDGTITGKAITFSGDPVNISTGNVIWGSAQISGDLDDLGYHSGCKVNDGFHSVMYRNIENIFGNLWQHMDGLNIKDYQAYICDDPTQYANDKFTAPYEAIGYVNANTSDRYIKEMGFDEDNPEVMLPTEVGGSSSTYYCDNYWCGAGNKIAYVGGSFNGSDAKNGLFAWNCNNASSHTNWNNGARLLI